MNNLPQIIIKEASDSFYVKQYQARLNQLGYGPITEDGVNGKHTFLAIKAYQSKNFDVFEHTLKIDGIMGPLTWASLFDEENIHFNTLSPLCTEVLKIARGEIGVCEVPPGSNSGPRVTEYLNSVNLGPGYPWCAGFVYWSFEKASVRLNRVNPLVRTASCMNHWKKSKGTKILVADAIANPYLIEPGSLFFIRKKAGRGHTGIVTGVSDGYIQTIEGNANAFFSGTGLVANEGHGVLALQRKIKDINVGFIKYW